MTASCIISSDRNSWSVTPSRYLPTTRIASTTWLRYTPSARIVEHSFLLNDTVLHVRTQRRLGQQIDFPSNGFGRLTLEANECKQINWPTKADEQVDIAVRRLTYLRFSLHAHRSFPST